MSKVALVLVGIVALVGFWVWSQKGPVKKMVVENTPATSGEYIRVKTVLDRDGGKLRVLIEPVGVSSLQLSAFSMEARMSRDIGNPPVNHTLAEAGWSFPIARVEKQTLKLAGICMEPSGCMLSGELEVANVLIENLINGDVRVHFGEENTRFLKKDATVIKFRYE